MPAPSRTMFSAESMLAGVEAYKLNDFEVVKVEGSCDLVCGVKGLGPWRSLPALVCNGAFR